ncbi:MAG: hypothetical protein PHT07_22980 [Paludibacter sp.]|nr:hypothetical protein [Paludibacter sp.]
MRNKLIPFFTLLIIALLSIQLYGQETNERTIHIMRAKQFYGSGAKMDIQINGISVCKMKSGSRLILKAKKGDTLNIQIVYPLMKKYKSDVLQILTNNEPSIFIDAYYWGTGYNPMMLYNHKQPEFNIELKKMNFDEGKIKFYDSTKYKDTEETIITKDVPDTSQNANP